MQLLNWTAPGFFPPVVFSPVPLFAPDNLLTLPYPLKGCILHVTDSLSHGAGGREMAALIDEVFLARYGDPGRVGDDSATVLLGSHRLAFTTTPSWSTRCFFPAATLAAWRWRAR